MARAVRNTTTKLQQTAPQKGCVPNRNARLKRFDASWMTLMRPYRGVSFQLANLRRKQAGSLPHDLPLHLILATNLLIIHQVHVHFRDR
jgi:hypothetical protein